MNDTMALNELADLFSILGNPDRLRILFELQNGPRDVASLVSTVGVSQSRTSQHLDSQAHHLVLHQETGARSLFAQSLSSPGMGRPRFRTLSHRANPRRTPAREYRCISHPLFKMRIRYGIRANISWMIDAHDGPSCVVACSIAPKLAVSPRG